MNTYGFIQARISHTLKDPHSKALEPDCLSPSVCNYDTVSGGEGRFLEDISEKVRDKFSDFIVLESKMCSLSDAH
jgi:hypothetical protein